MELWLTCQTDKMREATWHMEKVEKVEKVVVVANRVERVCPKILCLFP